MYFNMISSTSQNFRPIGHWEDPGPMTGHEPMTGHVNQTSNFLPEPMIGHGWAMTSHATPGGDFSLILSYFLVTFWKGLFRYFPRYFTQIFCLDICFQIFSPKLSIYMFLCVAWRRDGYIYIVSYYIFLERKMRKIVESSCIFSPSIL